MRICSLGRVLVFVALAGIGCGSSEGPDKSTSSAPPAANVKTQAVAKPDSPKTPLAADSPTQAQAKLQTLKLWLGPEEMITEIAMSEKEIMTGMMFRTQMAENEGMLFVFAGPHQLAFWMRNTLLPLSCAYIDPDGTILEVHDMKPKDETPIPSATARIQYVLEVKQGWFQRHNINVGTQIRTERGTLAETFSSRR
jgi:uncharacterized membrane protein (UPF0127 family)